MNSKKATKKLTNQELSAFCSQMYLILHAGISSIEGVSLMLEECHNPEEKELLSTLFDGVQEQGFLYSGLGMTHVFPSYMIQMVRLGEQSGKLDDVMNALTKHYEREAQIQSSIRNAILYPLIMIAMMVAVVVILMVKVMPIFNQVFGQLGQELTGFSRAIMEMGNGLRQYSYVFIFFIISLIGLLLYLTKTKKGRMQMRSIAYGLKPLEKFYEDMALYKFASGMNLTLSSGLNPSTCLELVTGLTEDKKFQSRLAKALEKVNANEDLSKALIDTGILKGMYARLTSIGSKTGALDEVMEKISAQSQESVDTRINTLLSVLEPTLVIILSLIVGVILLSVMLPLIGIMSSF